MIGKREFSVKPGHRFLATALAVLLLFAVNFDTVLAAEDTSYTLEAEKLKSLGLFRGTDIGFELERVPNRAEAGAMLVRLLGKESEALGQNYSHIFTDVPEWASRFIGYMWQNGLTKGVGGDLYAPYDPVDARSYLTFVLRSLGYSDDEGDFSWELAVDYSYEIGLISRREYEELTTETFTRGHMAAVSYNAMNFRMKGSEGTLAAMMVEQGAIDEATALEENFLFNMPDWERYLRYLENGEFRPYVIGLDLETALIELRKSGAANIDVSYSYDEIIPEGHVISQDFPAYIESGDSYDCRLEVSIGPTTIYHLQLQKIVDDKGWSKEAAPYIISAAKFLIRETILTRYDVFRRLEENIRNVVIVDEELSARMSFGAVYDSFTKDLYINRFILDEELILHELTHALSYSPASGKVGFVEIGDNTRAVTEAFTHYTAGKIDGISPMQLNEFFSGTENIVFGSSEYNGPGRNNFVLGVYAPLFTLAGRQMIERMYFLDVDSSQREIDAFDDEYGEGRFESLWALADEFITQKFYFTFEERVEMSGIYAEYLDGILECLEIDLQNAIGSENLLVILDKKLESISRQFPLSFLDYRARFVELRNMTIDYLSEFRDTGIHFKDDEWIFPDFASMEPLEIYNTLVIMGGATDVGYRIVESGKDEGFEVGILYMEPGSSGEFEIRPFPGDELEIGGMYMIEIPAFIRGYEEYTEMRDIVEDFGGYLADFSNLGSYIVGRTLEAEGFRFRYDFIYFDDVSPQMNGRIVGQFPEPGTAVIPGKTTIIVRILRKRPD
ncbi:MAG TPA: hypothetical protein PLP30_02695 [Clostridia bacterium]|nr:hypothetical protein [Clostridia bacterium]